MGNAQTTKEKKGKKEKKSKEEKKSSQKDVKRSIAKRLPKSDVLSTLSVQKKETKTKNHPHFVIPSNANINGMNGLGLFYCVPVDVLVVEILSQLDIRDILALSATSRAFFSLSSDDRLWKLAYKYSQWQTPSQIEEERICCWKYCYSSKYSSYGEKNARRQLIIEQRDLYEKQIWKLKEEKKSKLKAESLKYKELEKKAISFIFACLVISYIFLFKVLLYPYILPLIVKIAFFPKTLLGFLGYNLDILLDLQCETQFGILCGIGNVLSFLMQTICVCILVVAGLMFMFFSGVWWKECITRICHSPMLEIYLKELSIPKLKRDHEAACSVIEVTYSTQIADVEEKLSKLPKVASNKQDFSTSYGNPLLNEFLRRACVIQ